MKRFSIVIITYRRKKHVKNALEALNHLEGYKRDDYEVIVVDDGSDDGTYEFIKGTNRNYDLKYMYLERCVESCRSRARNYGWRAAVGEIVVFLDPDVIVRGDYLKEVDRYYALDKDLLVVGTRLMLPYEDIPCESVCDRSIFQKYAFSAKNLELLEVRHFAFDRLSYNMSAFKYPWLMVFSCSMVVPFSWLERAGGFDTGFKGWGLEDNELAYRLFREGIKIVVNSRLEALHQFHRSDPVEAGLGQREECAGLFLHKHPEALDLPREEILDFFRGKTMIDLGLKEDRPLRKVLELKDRGTLEDLKSLVPMLLKQEGVKVEIRDYVEDTDLDIWVQLLDCGNNAPDYRPVSRMLELKGPPG